MAVKVYVLLAMLVFAGVVMPVANAQLGGGLGGILSSVLSLTGRVSCSLGNSNNLSNGFANASVQLRCLGSVVDSATTNSSGLFSLVVPLSVLPTPLSDLLNGCKAVVTTPLASCNDSLPSTGVLSSPLSTPVSIIPGFLDLMANNFRLVVSDIVG